MVDFILLYVLMGLINLAGITTSIMIRSIIQIGSTGNILSARVSIGTVFYYRGIETVIATIETNTDLIKPLYPVYHLS